MCYFVTIAVNRAASELREFIPPGMALEPVHNPSVLEHLPASYQTFLMTSGGCSCDLYQPDQPPPRTKDPEARRKRYRKMGWSEAKIERAIADFSSTRAGEYTPGLRPDLRQVLTRMSKKFGELAVLVHWYDGYVETEKVTVHRTRSLDPQALEEEDCPILKDELVWIRSGRG